MSSDSAELAATLSDSASEEPLNSSKGFADDPAPRDVEPDQDSAEPPFPRASRSETLSSVRTRSIAEFGVDTETEPTGPGTEEETPAYPATNEATAAELDTEGVTTAELGAEMDITVELAVDEMVKDELDDGSGVRAELRTGAEATTGLADEDAGVTTPAVGKGDRSKIDVDATSPVELANSVVEATEHDADDPAVEDATGSDVCSGDTHSDNLHISSAKVDSAEHELMVTSTAELDAVAAELEIAILTGKSWGAEQDNTAESTVGAAETTVVTVVLQLAVTGLEGAATTLDVPVVDTTPVEEVAAIPTSAEESSSTSSTGSSRSKSKEASSPTTLAGRATHAAELRVTELEARRRYRRRRDKAAERRTSYPSDTAPKSSPANHSITSSCPSSPGRGIEYGWSGGWWGLRRDPAAVADTG
ncbi:unnamed protein product [Phytophthora fragariaefolia]|uniref:Unnamed protein product n=1 Tax=Phytophthora fragariaefolia TaxID=1490495 RepID=A0A9W6X2Z8_9STRA|nr:unnamed protein product [Phytophthora fragariaefolia]